MTKYNQAIFDELDRKENHIRYLLDNGKECEDWEWYREGQLDEIARLKVTIMKAGDREDFKMGQQGYAEMMYQAGRASLIQSIWENNEEFLKKSKEEKNDDN